LAARRVELLTVREGLDADAKRARLTTEHRRILDAVRNFFALE
jgi:hypothetical protein